MDKKKINKKITKSQSLLSFCESTPQFIYEKGTT